MGGFLSKSRVIGGRAGDMAAVQPSPSPSASHRLQPPASRHLLNGCCQRPDGPAHCPAPGSARARGRAGSVGPHFVVLIPLMHLLGVASHRRPLLRNSWQPRACAGHDPDWRGQPPLPPKRDPGITVDVISVGIPSDFHRRGVVRGVERQGALGRSRCRGPRLRTGCGRLHDDQLGC